MWEPKWTQAQDFGPGARFGHAIAYDSLRARCVLFGGSDGQSVLGDTWEWDGSYWTQYADFGPPPRSATAAAFETFAGGTQGRVVLFGGTGADGSALGDTWTWDGSYWTQVADSGPSARRGHVLVFDFGRGRTVLFGGSADGALTGDTWEWDGGSWQRALAREAPPPRELAGGAYGGNRTMVFGGTGAGGAILGDTWEWDGSHWTEIEGVEEPAPRAGGALAYNGENVALFGGIGAAETSPATLFGDTWQFDGQTWTQVENTGLQGRWQHAMAFDSGRYRLVMFGGSSSSSSAAALGDTWQTPGDWEGLKLTSFELSLGRGPQPAYGEMAFSGPAPAGGVVVEISVAP
ncbi:MAG: hypothetical protein JO372_25850, partial [Solirubrobacterales bacterium]|nr:hypothetical protein [Solirubrobacterales bacterium]